MSFILDALKKSEHERQQQAEAEFASVPSSPDAPRAPKWLWILGVLLVLNVAVLLGILMRPDSSAPVAAAPAPVATQSEVRSPAPQPQDTFSDRIAEARRNQPQPEAAADNSAAIDRPDPVQPDPAPPQPAATNPAPAAAFASLPTLAEVRVNNQLQLPDLHVDIHVYSPVPHERFVFINMSKYRENEVTKEGPTITRIEADGVVLRYQGVSFILPRD